MIIVALMAVFAIIASSAQLATGEKSLGVKLGYASHNRSAVTGLFFRYNITNHLRLVPEIGCAFRNRNQDAFFLDVNVHAPFTLTDVNRVSIYPFAGVTYNSWRTHFENLIDDDVTSHTNRFGVNLGAGFDLRCSKTLQFNIEAKYTLIKRYSGYYLTAGLSYIF